ncbi:MAG: alpha/beta hydrolase [Alphaproteobacteria bacterium]|nr:alpha/beta hydrolase [Alphaproteobacteria bacterium]
MSSADKIYLGYTKDELDAQYNNRRRYPQFLSYFETWTKWSEATRAALPCRLDVPYGPTPAETLDIFPAEKADAPIQVFIHGGYWYSLDKSHDSFVAEGFRPHGIATVVINYALAPTVRMDEIARQNRAALAWVWRNARSFGGDPARIHVSGQSAGGHLATLMLGTDWPAFGADLPVDLAKSGCSISGIYDLEPIRLCYLNDKVRMDEAEARRNSPVHQRYPVRAPLMFVSGDIESAEYARQAELMEKLWHRLNYPSEIVTLKGYNHFTMAHLLKEPPSRLTQAIVRMMGIT